MNVVPEVLTLVKFVERSEKQKSAATDGLAYVPIDETCGKNIPVFAHAGCATSLQPIFIVVIQLQHDGMYVVGYYDLASETYTKLHSDMESSYARLDIRGDEHGRYLHNGFPLATVPSWWPIATLNTASNTPWKLTAIRRARAVIVASEGIDTFGLLKTLLHRIAKEGKRSHHIEVYQRHQAIWRQIASERCVSEHDGSAVCTHLKRLQQRIQGPSSHLPFGRAVPSVCYESPAFFEQPLRLHTNNPTLTHRVIHKRLGQ